MKILFLCSQNRLRSLTAEKLFDGVDGHVVRSAGTEAGARIRVTEGILGWADLIFVMEKRHRSRIQKKFRDEVSRKRIVCLHIPDDYDFMEEALVRRLHTVVPAYIDDHRL